MDHVLWPRIPCPRVSGQRRLHLVIDITEASPATHSSRRRHHLCRLERQRAMTQPVQIHQKDGPGFDHLTSVRHRAGGQPMRRVVALRNRRPSAARHELYRCPSSLRHTRLTSGTTVATIGTFAHRRSADWYGVGDLKAGMPFAESAAGVRDKETDEPRRPHIAEDGAGPTGPWHQRNISLGRRIGVDRKAAMVMRSTASVRCTSTSSSASALS